MIVEISAVTGLIVFLENWQLLIVSAVCDYFINAVKIENRFIWFLALMATSKGTLDVM